MRKSNTTVYLILKGMIILLGIISIIFLSNFWIGSDETWNNIKLKEFVPLLMTRTLFLAISGILFLCLSFAVDMVFKRDANFNNELIVLIIFSFFLNVLVILF